MIIQNLALPMDGEYQAVEHVPFVRSENIQKPLNEVVENFREQIEIWFVRYQNFYDRSHATMRSYRLAHVALVTSVYNELVTVFGEDIGAIRHSADSFRRSVDSSDGNACVDDIVERQEAISTQTGFTFQGCAIFANTTLSTRLLNMFYPAFMNIQTTMSSVPVAVIDALARGNVFQDEEEILEYLEGNYRAKEFQWMTAVSQLLRWETNRFEVDGLFLVDEMRICLAEHVLEYVMQVTALEQELLGC